VDNQKRAETDSRPTLERSSRIDLHFTAELIYCLAAWHSSFDVQVWTLHKKPKEPASDQFEIALANLGRSQDC
jgi:hypothetical protein